MSIQLKIKTAREVYKAGGYSLVYIANPEQSLDSEQQKVLLIGLGPAASGGFGRTVTAESMRKHVLEGQDHLLLAKFRGTFVGFAAAKNLERMPGIFLTGVVFSPECQGKGLGSAVFRALLGVTKCQILAFTTQSPIMYLMLMRISKLVYPWLSGNPIPPDLRELGIQLMKSRRGEFCSETFVNKGLYPQCLYSKFPWCNDSQVNAFFRRMLHFEGDKTRDGFLLIGETG